MLATLAVTAVPSGLAAATVVHASALPGVTLLQPAGNGPNPRTPLDHNADLRIEIFALTSDGAIGDPLGPSFSVAPMKGVVQIKIHDAKGYKAHYHTSWKTKDSHLASGALVRVEIRLASASAGPACNFGVTVTGGCVAYFDVGLQKGKKKEPWAAGILALENGRTLPIKFHVAAGALDLPDSDASQLAGDPGSPATNAIPSLDFEFDPADYAPHPDLGGLTVSFDTLFIVFKLGTTVGDANALLKEIGAQIIGGLPGVAGQAAGILQLRVPITSHSAMDSLIATLNADPRVRVATQDTLFSTDEIPQFTNDPPDWAWDVVPQGGNWGLEASRVPQLWSLNDSLVKHGRETITGVLDAGFYPHPDLVYDTNLSTGPGQAHGTHVAGTIAATYDNGIGVDGVDPFVDLAVEQYDRNAGGWGIFNFIDELPDLEVINVSLGVNWYKLNPPVDPALSPTAQGLVIKEAMLFELWQTVLAVKGQRLPLIVAAAGNDSGSPALGNVNVDAKWSSPWNYAALVDGTENVIVVEAVGLDPDGVSISGALFSDVNGHVSAPGLGIESTGSPTAPYMRMSGTSMAAPHVTGIASYLLSLDPSLTPVELRGLLLAGGAPAVGASPRVDAFASALLIDPLRHNTSVLERLLDIDDGTRDGNLRLVCVASGCTAVTTEDFDADGGIGDGVIDMSDFRRWRDWLLEMEAVTGLSLDGAPDHPKKDVNHDEFVDPAEFENVFPDGDFNGDGALSRTATRYVPGQVDSVATDLEVLQALFADPDYAAARLPELLDSADIHVDPSGCMADGVIGVETTILVTDSMDLVEDRWDDEAPMGHEYTVPVEAAGTGYSVSIEAFDQQGNVAGTAHNSFVAGLGSDTWYAPTCGKVTLTPPQLNIILDAGDSTTPSVTLASEGLAASWEFVNSLANVEPATTGGTLAAGGEVALDPTITCPSRPGGYGGYLNLEFRDDGGGLIESGVPEALVVDIVCLTGGVEADPSPVEVRIPAGETASRSVSLTNKGTALLYEAQPGEHVSIDDGEAGSLAKLGQAQIEFTVTCPNNPGTYETEIALTFSREDGKPVRVPVPESVPVNLDCTGPIHIVSQWLLNSSNINPWDRHEDFWQSEEALGTAQYQHAFGLYYSSSNPLEITQTAIPPLGFGTVTSETTLTADHDVFERWPSGRTVSVQSSLVYRSSYDGTTAAFSASWSHAYSQSRTAFDPILPKSAGGYTDVIFDIDTAADVVASWSCDGQFGDPSVAGPSVRLLHDGQPVFESVVGQTSACSYDGTLEPGRYRLLAGSLLSLGATFPSSQLAASRADGYTMELTFP